MSERGEGCPKCGQTRHGFDVVAHGIAACPIPGCGYTSQRWPNEHVQLPKNTLTMEGQRDD